MTSNDLFELATRNLRKSLLRTSLTTIGISVGVASLVSMLSLGIGLQQMASKRLQKSGLFDTVTVTAPREQRGPNRQPEKTPAEIRALDDTARQEIERMPGVVEVFPDIRFGAQLRFDDKQHNNTVAGIPASMQHREVFEGLKGAFFSSETAPEAILQRAYALNILGKTEKPSDDKKIDIAELARDLVGKTLSLTYAERVANTRATETMAYSVAPHTLELKIVGVLELDPDSMRGPARARVFVPLKFAQNLHAMQASDLRDSTRSNSTPVYTSLNVRVKDPTQVLPVETAIKKLGFSTFSILDATRSMQQFFAVLDMFLGAFGSLALAVASIGIVNTLVMAILERRREIGIMKAIGASDGDVKKIFFAEAGAMGLFGGVIGVALGWGIGRVINFGTNIYLDRQGLPPEQIWFVPWWLVAGAIAFAVVVSLLSGWYPASRASRLDPVQALRYE